MNHLRILLYIVIFFLTACKQNPRSVESGEVVNVYTACYLPSDEQLFKSFERSTGIKVNILYDNNTNLLKKLRQQAAQPEADLLILKGVCYLQQARNDSLLQTSSLQPNVGYTQQFSDSANYWYPLTYDPLVIAYHLQDTSMTPPPASYAELAKAEWKGKLFIADSLDLLHCLAAAMLADRGEEATLEWLKQYKYNLAPKAKGTTPQAFERMAADSASIALITASEYITASKPSNIKITLPSQADKGAYALINGVSLVRHAPHPAYAAHLLSFLLSTEIQRTYAQAHGEYPASPEVQPPPSLQTLGQFRLNTTSINASIRYCDSAKQILKEAGF